MIVRKNGLTTATVGVSVLNATGPTVVTANANNSNEILVSPGTATVAAGGSVNFSISSRRNNAGFTYQVTFRSTSCGNATVSVIVRI